MADSEGMSDRDLLAATAAGERSAFEQLYRRYEQRVYQYALSFVRDRSLAEDVLIDAMTSVWDGAGKFAGDSQVSTWILGIARHKALDAVRRSGRRAQEDSLEDSPDLESEQDSPVEAAERSNSQSLARRAMERLSADHQEILRLAFFEELPYEDIAALLSIPANTVKTRVYYAKQQFRHFVDQLTRQGVAR